MLKLPSFPRSQIPKWSVPEFSNHPGVVSGGKREQRLQISQNLQEESTTWRSRSLSPLSQQHDLWLCHLSPSVSIRKLREVTPTPKGCCKNYFVNRITKVNMSGKGTKLWRGRQHPHFRMCYLQYRQKDKKGVKGGVNREFQLHLKLVY